MTADTMTPDIVEPCRWPLSHRYQHTCSCICAKPYGHAGYHRCTVQLSALPESRKP